MRSRSPVEEDFVNEERPTFKLSKGTSKFVLHRNRALFWRYNNGACANTSWHSSTRDKEPRTRIQKPREGLWVASNFLPFTDTENQCLSTFDSPSFRTHNKSHN